jgi:predicted ABC-type ATPase
MSDETLMPRLIVVAGPNGAGKTSITEQLLRHEWMVGCEYVNPDYIARDEFGDWNAPDAVSRAAVRAEEVREQCVREGRSLAFETVLSMPDKIDFIRRAKQAGFFVRLFFVGTMCQSAKSSLAIHARWRTARWRHASQTAPISTTTQWTVLRHGCCSASAKGN